jgi:hypothetical protein
LNPPDHDANSVTRAITILHDSGFIIDALHELYAPPDAPDHPYYALASAEWARRWPAEEIWAAPLAD